MAPVQVAQITPALAAQLLAGVEAHAPRGMASARDVAGMCERGLCFAANVGAHSQVAYVLQVREGCAWISAAKGSGRVDLVRQVLPAIELQVSGACGSIGFQTARPGLVKKAQAMGYEIRGWILGKELPWS